MDRDFDAFVCHSSTDASTANRIVETLESRGVRCWIAPRDVRPGYDFQVEIVSALESVRCLILLFSAKCNDSEHVHREVLLADNAKTPVYPLRIEDAHPSGAMKYQLANRQWLDYFEDRNRVLESLVGRIARRRSVLPPKPGAVSPAEAITPQLPPAPPPDSKDMVADDGLRRWLPPALDPVFLLFQFKGRIGRRSYLYGIFLTTLLPILLVGWLGMMLAPVLQAAGGGTSTMAGAFSLVGVGLIGFAYLYCYLALMSKRLHDFGLSAWWSLLQIGPVIVAALTATFISMSGGLQHAIDEAQGETVYQKLTVLIAILSSALSTGSYLWLVFWPGKSTTNKYGPAPSFSRSWRPFDTLVQRASARSEFDVPFVILSTDGRIGPKGLATGFVFLVWLTAVLWFFKVIYNGSLAPLDFDNTGNVFISSIGVIGIAATALFAFTVFSCIVAKRLHDIGMSAWLQIFISVVLVVVVVLFGDNYDATRGYVIASVWIGLVFAALFIAPGAKDFNAYGPPPGFRVEALREQKP